MKLKIRYENEYKTIVLNEKDTEKLWVSLDITEQGLTQEEKEELIQEKWEKEFNRPDYNSWHRHNRHIGYSKAQPDDEADEVDTSEPLMSEVRDSRIFLKDEIKRHEKWEYESCCDKIRQILKPDAAEMVIAIALDGMKAAEYADLIGDKPNNISHRYRAAIKKLQKDF